MRLCFGASAILRRLRPRSDMTEELRRNSWGGAPRDDDVGDGIDSRFGVAERHRRDFNGGDHGAATVTRADEGNCSDHPDDQDLRQRRTRPRRPRLRLRLHEGNNQRTIGGIQGVTRSSTPTKSDKGTTRKASIDCSLKTSMGSDEQDHGVQILGRHQHHKGGTRQGTRRRH